MQKIEPSDHKVCNHTLTLPHGTWDACQYQKQMCQDEQMSETEIKETRPIVDPHAPSARLSYLPQSSRAIGCETHIGTLPKSQLASTATLSVGKVTNVQTIEDPPSARLSIILQHHPFLVLNSRAIYIQQNLRRVAQLIDVITLS